MATIDLPDQNLNEEENDRNITNVATGGGPAASSSGAAVAQPSGAQPRSQRQGSGRFTNIQKYLDANRQGGERIAGGIGENIGGEAQQQRQQTEQFLGGLREGIQQGRQATQQGQGFLQDLEGIGKNLVAQQEGRGLQNRGASLGIQNFASRPDFNRFQDIQAGRAIDENLLQGQQQQLRGAAQQFLGSSQEAADRLATEGGRFELLRDTFGGSGANPYTRGQQRLDQAFLANQGLQPLQEQTRANVRDARDFMQQAARKAIDVSNLTAEEQRLMSDIETQSMANIGKFDKMLSDFVDPINQQRDAEWRALESALQDYRMPSGDQVGTTVIGPGLSLDQARRLGVTDSQGFEAFNIFDNLTAEQIAQRGRRATGAQDVATEADVARYRALAQIAGVEPQLLTQAGNIGEAFTAATGESNLRNRLVAEQQREQSAANAPGQIDVERIQSLVGPGFATHHPVPFPVIREGQRTTLMKPLNQVTPSEAQEILNAYALQGGPGYDWANNTAITESLKSIIDNHNRSFRRGMRVGGKMPFNQPAGPAKQFEGGQVPTTFVPAGKGF